MGSPAIIVKDQDTLIKQSVTKLSRIIVKQVVNDEFMKQIKTVRHSFNTKGIASYRAVPPPTNNNHNSVFKKS